MSTSIVPVRHAAAIKRPPLLINLYRNAVRRRLENLAWGGLRVIEAGELHAYGDPDAEMQVTLHVSDPRFWKEIALGGGNGAGEAYIMGWWHCDDLVGLVRMLCRNRHVLSHIEGGLSLLTKPVHWFAHFLHRNTKSGAARNISAHYDLGNDFFGLMLDETMMYSAAYYPRPDASLLEAQICKLDRLCRKLRLQPGDHLLEIGTGWGGMAIHAARNYGCRVTTTTISKEQHRLAVERVKRAGLSHRITVLLEDYRDLQGRYDKIVSIEMIEAIGYRQYPTFFRTCMNLLHDNGLALIQAITIADQEYERAKHHVDYIKRYIFPGSCIPSVSALQQAMTTASDLRCLDLEDVSEHYVKTLAVWRANCEHHQEAITAMGHDEYFQRLWEFYLCYCEGGFAERAIGDVHLLMARPQWRPHARKAIEEIPCLTHSAPI